MSACLAAVLVLGCQNETDTSPAGGVACKQTLADYCGQAQCRMTLPTDRSAFCADAPGAQVSTIDGCGYSVAQVSGVDFGSRYYYSTKTGELVAIISYMNAQSSCAAGPSRFVVPQCETAAHNSIPCALDAGGD